MTKKKQERLNILAIGLDSFSIESIKQSLRDNKVKYQISFIQDIAELEQFRNKHANAIFFYSNKQGPKTVNDIRIINQLLPRAAITLLSPRADYSCIVTAFRAGLFDFLSLPIKPNEIRTVINRLKLHGAIQIGQWNPEGAVLQLFSRPESFSNITDVANGLNQYLSLFFEIEKDFQFSSDDRVLSSMQRKLKLTERQLKRIKRFLSDETGLIFGLRFVNDRFYFLIKNGEGKLKYLVARKTSDLHIKEILGPYLINVLKTSLSILIDNKLREEMKLLTLIDEVTGLYNQRKLVEDLEYYVASYQHDQQGFSLLFVDIDFFKNVNDQYGHVVGSQLLIDMAEVIKVQLRSSDLVYRYGGDEFIILLPRTDLEVSKKIALRMSIAVKEAEFKIGDDEKYRLSISVGIARFPEDAASEKSIIEFADKMMYMSKKSGRGKVFHVTEVIA
jgi:diguanylate cyclase (GGDEF)-like protein